MCRLRQHFVPGVILHVILLLPATMQAAEPLEGAAWLRDPVFRGAAVLDVFAAQGTKDKATEVQNRHTYFRKEIELHAKPVKAMLHITGDDYYKFSIDGRFIVQGPEPGYPFAHPYYVLPLAELPDPGRHCLAAHGYYHGVTSRAFNSADNRSGFAMVLELTFADGSTRQYATDESWKCLSPKTFSSSRMFGYATQFNENMDLRVEPHGWRQVGFDDSGWTAPLVERQDHILVEQGTPPLEHWRADPVTVKPKGNGRYFFDFGRELVGHTRIAVRGPAGHVMTVWHGEELDGPHTVRHKMRCNCDYEDKITLSGRDEVVEFFDYRGFRYVEILDSPEPPRVWVDVRHHPFDPRASRFHSSDELLNRIWELCKNGVQMGCQGVVVDCPTREKGQYTGDTYMTLLSQLLLTADPTLARKAIQDFQLSQRFDEGMLAVAPGGFRQELAEWSLCWPLMLEYYYRMTGNRELVCEIVDGKVLDKLLGWFARLEAPSGLLTGVDRKKWVLVDWPANLRGDYDYDGTKNDENAVVNAFYYASLRSAARLMRDAGRDGTAFDQRAYRVGEAFVRRLLDPKTGLFLDGPSSTHSSLHASAFPLCWGMVPESSVPQVIDLVRQKRLDCGLYAAPYVIAGCYRAGQGELAYELLTSRDKHSWSSMLDAGATTPLEAWTPDLKWNTSWCHPACATPIWLIATYLMGLEPAEPGWKAIRLAPQLPATLRRAELTLPTPAGSITAVYDKQQGYILTVPDGIPVVIEAPKTLAVKVIHRPSTRRENTR